MVEYHPTVTNLYRTLVNSALINHLVVRKELESATVGLRAKIGRYGLAHPQTKIKLNEVYNLSKKVDTAEAAHNNLNS